MRWLFLSKKAYHIKRMSLFLSTDNKYVPFSFLDIMKIASCRPKEIFVRTATTLPNIQPFPTYIRLHRCMGGSYHASHNMFHCIVKEKEQVVFRYYDIHDQEVCGFFLNCNKRYDKERIAFIYSMPLVFARCEVQNSEMEINRDRKLDF